MDKLQNAADPGKRSVEGNLIKATTKKIDDIWNAWYQTTEAHVHLASRN